MPTIFDELISDLEEVCDDIQYDYGFDTVAEEKLRDIIDKIKKLQQ